MNNKQALYLDKTQKTSVHIFGVYGFDKATNRQRVTIARLQRKSVTLSKYVTDNVLPSLMEIEIGYWGRVIDSLVHWFCCLSVIEIGYWGRVIDSLVHWFCCDRDWILGNSY